jgi:hypothetical protein
VVILVTNGRAKDSVVRQKVRFKGSLGLGEPLRASRASALEHPCREKSGTLHSSLMC